jgi:GxxExxY protein
MIPPASIYRSLRLVLPLICEGQGLVRGDLPQINRRYQMNNIIHKELSDTNYKGDYIGGYIADLVVDNKVILELKAVSALTDIMSAQIINYLKLSKLPVGYIINFNSMRLEFKSYVVQRE